MFCKNCGNKIEEDSKFCSFCGEKILFINDHQEVVKEKEEEKEKVLFYSLNWERVDALRVSALPLFDILVTEKFLYLIPLSLNFIQDVGTLTNRGPLFAGLLGGLISTTVDSSRSKTVNKIRSPWRVLDMKFIPPEYEKIVFLKIPKENFKNNFTFLKSSKGKMVAFAYKDSILFKYDGKKIKLQNDPQEFLDLKNYIESHSQ
ncbi:MAG: zinc ribbon domain-containing protein [Patescibacteria group bacterium]